MAYNIAHLDKIQTWFDANKKDNWSIYFNNVVAQPAYLNPRVLPNEVLQSIEHKLPNITYEQNNSKLLDMFVNYTKDLDKIRNTNVLELVPELGRYINGMA